jgi:hypothetical protein
MEQRLMGCSGAGRRTAARSVCRRATASTELPSPAHPKPHSQFGASDAQEGHVRAGTAAPQPTGTHSSPHTDTYTQQLYPGVDASPPRTSHTAGLTPIDRAVASCTLSAVCTFRGPIRMHSTAQKRAGRRNALRLSGRPPATPVHPRTAEPAACDSP